MPPFEFASVPSAVDSDEELARRVRAGEAHLFEQILRRYNRRLFRVARSIVRSAAEAEDVVQETFVRAFTHLEQFEGRARFGTWLMRIAVYESYARVRRAAREASLGGEGERQEALAMETESPMADPERSAGDHELRGLLEQAIDRLPESFRTVFVLRAVEELSVAETAECLDLVEETVKTRFFRARAMLREKLAGHIDALMPAVYDFHLSRCDRIVGAVMGRLGIRDNRSPRGDADF